MLLEAPGGSVTSAIDPDFKRNRFPAGSVVRGQRLADVWTHISLSQLSSTQHFPDAAALKDTRSHTPNYFLSLKTALPFHLVRGRHWVACFPGQSEIPIPPNI